jgi:pimeloyl-ACP methyl ester carboxylesterase
MSKSSSFETLGRSVALFFACFGCADAVPETPAQESHVATNAEAARHGRRLAQDVLLVHGAWADGSCWSSVIKALQGDGYEVKAVQLREQSLADDASIVREAIDALPRPVVVAGHSYGGFVMSEATAGASNVVGLVFVAAFAPDEGESVGELAAQYPPAPALQHLELDDQFNTTIEPDAFVRHFAPDIPVRDARVLAAVQHPTAYTILTTKAGTPGWKTIPSYYQVSKQDEVIDPGLQRMFAARMAAKTIELSASHVSLISRPQVVVDLIDRAARGR